MTQVLSGTICHLRADDDQLIYINGQLVFLKGGKPQIKAMQFDCPSSNKNNNLLMKKYSTKNSGIPNAEGAGHHSTI
eukprot:scaffold4669_cov108-Skeletonema_menzelii.AAC.2